MNDLQSLVTTAMSDTSSLRSLGARRIFLRSEHASPTCTEWLRAGPEGSEQVQNSWSASCRGWGGSPIFREQKSCVQTRQTWAGGSLTWIIYRPNSATIKSIFQQKPRMLAPCILIMPAYMSAYSKCTLLKQIQNYAFHK